MSSQPPHSQPHSHLVPTQQFPVSHDISVNTAAELREYLEQMGFSPEQQPNLFQQINTMQHLQTQPLHNSSQIQPSDQSQHQSQSLLHPHPQHQLSQLLPQSSPQFPPQFSPQPPLLSQSLQHQQSLQQFPPQSTSSLQPSQTSSNLHSQNDSSNHPNSTLPLSSSTSLQQLSTQPSTQPTQPSTQLTASGVNPNLIRNNIVDHIVTFLQSTFANTNFLPQSQSIDLVKILLFLEEKRCYSAEIAEAFARTFPDHFISPLLVRAAKKGYVLSQYCYCYLLILARRNTKHGVKSSHFDKNGGLASFLSPDDPMAISNQLENGENMDTNGENIHQLPLNTPITQEELDILEAELNALHSSTDIVYVSNIKQTEEKKSSKLRMATIAALCSLAFVATTRFFLQSGNLSQKNDQNAGIIGSDPASEMKQLLLPQQLLTKLDQYTTQQTLSSKQLSSLTQNVDVLQAAIDIIKHHSTMNNSSLSKIITEVNTINTKTIQNDEKTDENITALKDIQAHLIVLSNDVKNTQGNLKIIASKKSLCNDENSDDDSNTLDNDDDDESEDNDGNDNNSSDKNSSSSLLSPHNYHLSNPFFNSSLFEQIMPNNDDSSITDADGTQVNGKKKGGKKKAPSTIQLQQEITNLKHTIESNQEQMEDVLFQNFIRMQNTIQDLQGVLLNFAKAKVGKEVQENLAATNVDISVDDNNSNHYTNNSDTDVKSFIVASPTDTTNNNIDDLKPFSSSSSYSPIKIPSPFPPIGSSPSSTTAPILSTPQTSTSNPFFTTPEMDSAMQNALSILPFTNDATTPPATSTSTSTLVELPTSAQARADGPLISIPTIDKLLAPHSSINNNMIPFPQQSQQLLPSPTQSNPIEEALSIADHFSTQFSSLSDQPQPKKPIHQPHPMSSSFCLQCLDRSNWEEDFHQTLEPVKLLIQQHISGENIEPNENVSGPAGKPELFRLVKMIRMYLLNISKEPSNPAKRKISSSNPSIKAIQEKPILKELMVSIGFTFQWQWCQLDLQCICDTITATSLIDSAHQQCKCKCAENKMQNGELWSKPDQPQGTVCICGTLHRVQFALLQMNALLTGL